MLPGRTDPSGYTIAAWVLTGVALVLVLQLHVLPALLAGMLVYELVHVIAPTMNEHISDKRAKIIAVGLFSALVVVLVTLLILGAIVFFRSDAGNLSALLARMAEIIEDHIRMHVVDPARERNSSRARGAEELIEVVQAYLK